MRCSLPLWASLCALSLFGCGRGATRTSEPESEPRPAPHWTESDDPQFAVTRLPAETPPRAAPAASASWEVELEGSAPAEAGRLVVRARFPRAEPAPAGSWRPPTWLEPSKARRLEERRPALEAPVDARGQARLYELPVGVPIVLELLRDGRVPLRQSAPDGQAAGERRAWRAGHDSRVDLLQLVPGEFTLAAGERRRTRLARLEPARVRGTIVDEEGRGIAQLELWLGLPAPDEIGLIARLCPRELDRFAITFTDDRGRFELRGLPPGTWLIGIPSSVANARRPTRVLPLARPLELGAGQTLELQLATAQRGGLSGRAVDAAGEPLAGVELGLRLEGFAGEWPLRSDAAGEFRFEPCPACAVRLFGRRASEAGRPALAGQLGPLAPDAPEWRLPDLCLRPVDGAASELRR